jgi:hypothetical protein
VYFAFHPENRVIRAACWLYYSITISDVAEIIIHNKIPCNIGFIPTDFSVSLERPLPIKNKVNVNPILEICTIELLKS